MLQCVAMCCSVLQCVDLCLRMYGVCECVAVCCNVLQCLELCLGMYCVCVCVLQCVAVCCSVFLCVNLCLSSNCVFVCTVRGKELLFCEMSIFCVKTAYFLSKEHISCGNGIFWNLPKEGANIIF